MPGAGCADTRTEIRPAGDAEAWPNQAFSSKAAELPRDAACNCFRNKALVWEFTRSGGNGCPPTWSVKAPRNLLQGILQAGDPFQGLPRIRKRISLPGGRTSASCWSTRRLSQLILERLGGVSARTHEAANPSWTIQTSAARNDLLSALHFGSPTGWFTGSNLPARG
jgi:hypothetical protein